MSPERNTRLIKNIGTLATGDLDNPVRQADSIYIADGLISEIGNGLPHPAEVVIDARGLTAMPGLIDSHSHPTFGEFTPAQEAHAWVTHYLHGGVTALISAGELHLPGLPVPPDPATALSLALLAKRCYDQLRPSGVKVYAGTLLLVPRLKEEDFAVIAAAGIRLVKFIFYDYRLLPTGEAERYVAWAHQRGIRVKIHSGGVSRSGTSQVAGAAVVKHLRPDIVGHITGGPIPMPEDDIAAIVAETDLFLEICSSSKPRMALRLMDLVKAREAFHRVVIGTDTSGGTGVIPRGMLHQIAFLSAVGGVAPEVAVAMATGNAARAHGLAIGTLEEGKPADLVLLDRVQGSVAKDVMDSFALGDLPGTSLAMIDGEIRVAGRSQQTPPPERTALIAGGR